MSSSFGGGARRADRRRARFGLQSVVERGARRAAAEPDSSSSTEPMAGMNQEEKGVYGALQSSDNTARPRPDHPPHRAPHGRVSSIWTEWLVLSDGELDRRGCPGRRCSPIFFPASFAAYFSARPGGHALELAALTDGRPRGAGPGRPSARTLAVAARRQTPTARNDTVAAAGGEARTREFWRGVTSGVSTSDEVPGSGRGLEAGGSAFAPASRCSGLSGDNRARLLFRDAGRRRSCGGFPSAGLCRDFAPDELQAFARGGAARFAVRRGPGGRSTGSARSWRGRQPGTARDDRLRRGPARASPATPDSRASSTMPAVAARGGARPRRPSRPRAGPNSPGGPTARGRACSCTPPAPRQPKGRPLSLHQVGGADPAQPPRRMTFPRGRGVCPPNGR